MKEYVKNEMTRLLDEAQTRTMDEGSLYLIQSVRLLAGTVDLIAKRVDALTLFHIPPIEELEEANEAPQVS